MSKPLSLQARLGISLGLLLTLLWIGAASVTALLLRQEINEVFDSALQETAERLLPLAVMDIVEREGWLHLSVEDDGCGAELRVFESPQAYGIMGMRERARHFGGVIEIDSQPGRGTRMRLSMPLPSWEGAP